MASLQTAAGADTWRAQFMAGPYRSVEEYCRLLHTRKITAATGLGPVTEELAGYICEPNTQNANPCLDIKWTPQRGQALSQARLIGITVQDKSTHCRDS